MSTMQSGTGWSVAHVDEVPPVKPDWPDTWKSIRHHFGVIRVRHQRRHQG